MYNFLSGLHAKLNFAVEMQNVTSLFFLHSCLYYNIFFTQVPNEEKRVRSNILLLTLYCVTQN